MVVFLANLGVASADTARLMLQLNHRYDELASAGRAVGHDLRLPAPPSAPHWSWRAPPAVQSLAPAVVIERTAGVAAVCAALLALVNAIWRAPASGRALDVGETFSRYFTRAVSRRNHNAGDHDSQIKETAAGESS